MGVGRLTPERNTSGASQVRTRHTSCDEDMMDTETIFRHFLPGDHNIGDAGQQLFSLPSTITESIGSVPAFMSTKC